MSAIPRLAPGDDDVHLAGEFSVGFATVQVWSSKPALDESEMRMALADAIASHAQLTAAF